MIWHKKPSNLVAQKSIYNSSLKGTIRPKEVYPKKLGQRVKTKNPRRCNS